MADFEINNLPEIQESVLTQEDVFNSIEEYFTTKGKVRATTRFVSTDIEIGDSSLVVDAGNAVDMGPDIQRALDTLNERGGGTVFLKVGTYTVKTALTGYPSVSIAGISPSATIIDFVSTAANLSYAGTGVYSTGTITSITSGVNVTGSGTSWLANASAGQYLFIGTRHYKIAAVTSDTTLVLQEGYTDNVTMPGAAYRISSAIVDVKLSNFSVKGSTGTGIVFTDTVQLTLDNLQSILCNKGFSFTHVSRFNADRVLAVSNTSNGYEFTNVGLSDWESVNATSNGGHGFVWNNVKTVSALISTNANTSDGINATDVDQTILIIEASGNGGQGIELVSGCDENDIDGLFVSNTSDGVKLTATSDRNHIKGIYKSNGGYGINIAASSCDDNTIDVPTFSGNSSGTYSDSGTNTNIVFSTAINNIEFLAGEALSANQAVFLATGSTTDVTLVDITSDTGTENVGDSNNRLRIAQSFSLAAASVVNKVVGRIFKDGSPADNMVASIQADSSGVPSGTPLISASVAGASIGTSAANITFSFSTPLNLSASTTYWLVFERSGSVDSSNFYRINSNNGNPYADGVAKNYNANTPAWETLNTVNHDLRVSLFKTFTSGRVYLTSAAQASTTALLGFSKASYAVDSTATIQYAGVKENMSGLTLGSTYYLANAQGSIATSAGTVSKIAGRALSTTQLQILYTI